MTLSEFPFRLDSWNSCDSWSPSFRGSRLRISQQWGDHESLESDELSFGTVGVLREWLGLPEMGMIRA
jgi:hypothetical protein